MGPGSIAWLASAPTVAASSLDLVITDPRPLVAGISQAEFRSLLDAAPALPSVTISEPAPDVSAAESNGSERVAVEETHDDTPAIQGKAQLFGDHVDTDAMIPGEFCHLTEPEDIKKAAFYHVRPDFVERIDRGESILVAGEGWGSGSSREHAVWALKYAGVKAVIAKSYAFIHKRNLVNEAVPYFVVTDARFFEAVEDGDALSIRAEEGVIVHAGNRYRTEPVSSIAIQIQAAGGIVPAVQEHGKSTFDVLTTR
jgi:aconitate hydratase/homoaconitate hydratase